MVGGMLRFSLMVIMAVGAPYWGTLDPFLELNLIERLRAPSMAHWFGTDMLGRDLYSRTVYGSRISLIRWSVCNGTQCDVSASPWTAPVAIIDTWMRSSCVSWTVSWPFLPFSWPLP